MAYVPKWWGQAPISGLKVKEQQYRGNDGGYRPYMYDVTGLQRQGDTYIGPGGVRLDAKGRVVGQYYEGGAERTLGGAAGGGGGGGGGAGVPGIPGASVMGQQVAAGLAEYKKALARLNQNRLGTLTQFGYRGEIDPTNGVLKNMSVDATNPYGVYQGLRRNNAFQFEDLRDARLARGLGSKGLGAQGLDRARHEWGAADTSMAQALTGALSGFDEQQQSAWQGYQNMLWQMQQEAARSAAEDGDFGYPYDGAGAGDAGAGMASADPTWSFDPQAFGGASKRPKAKLAKKIAASQGRGIGRRPANIVQGNKKKAKLVRRVAATRRGGV